jgi:hypothetical protein
MKVDYYTNTVYNRVKEIKFWNISASEFDSNFFERYYGRSFKYYAPISPWLVGSYVP